MGGQRRDGDLHVVVDHLAVGGPWPVLEQPTRWVGNRIVRGRNGIGELDVVTLVGADPEPISGPL